MLCWTVESGSVPILHYALKSNGIGIGGQGSIRSGFKHNIISLLARGLMVMVQVVPYLCKLFDFLLFLCDNSCIRLSLVGIIVYSFISHNTTFPQHERSEAERMRGPQRMR